MSAKICIFFDIFLLCNSVIIYSAQSAVMDGTCFLQSLRIRTVSCYVPFRWKWKRRGLGKIRKRGQRPKVQIIWQKATWLDIIGEFGLSSLCLQLAFNGVGGITEQTAKRSHSEAALQSPGTWMRVYQVKPSAFFSLILSSISDFNGHLFPACFIEWLFEKVS